MKYSPALRSFVLASFALASVSSALAQTTYFWDADGDATAGTGGSGTWNTGSSLWRNGSATGTLSQWPNTDPALDYAQLEGTAGTVTLNSDSQNINVNRIIFGTTGYEIKGPLSGTAALNLSGTSAQINTGASISATISANISGSTGFSKTGDGGLTLKGTNTYSGTTTVSAGSITVEGDHSGGGGWTVGANAASTALTFAAGSTISVGAGNNVGTVNGGGSAGRTIVVAGSVTSSSTSNLTINGRNTVSINSGGSWNMQGGTLTIQPLNSGFGSTLNVNTGGSFTYSGSTNIVLAKSTSTGTGNATLNLSGGTFTTSRGISNTNAGTGTGTTNLNFTNGGTLKISNNIASLIIQGSSTFNVSTGTGGGVIDTNGFNTAIGVAITGAGSLTKNGAGTLTLSGTNLYAGGTHVLGGVLNTTQASALASYATAGNVVINGGTLGVQVGGSGWTTGQVNTLLTNATKTSGALGIDTTNSSITQWTAFTTTNLGTSLGLNKLGANSLTLDQTNTYTGATTVSAGTLYVTGALSNSAVTVEASGTISSNGAAGTLGNGLTIQEGGNLDLTGATIGFNSTGILSLTGGSLTLGNLTFQNLVGWDWLNAPEGTYELIDGAFSINWGNTAYLSEETAYDFGNGKKGYFSSGSLNVVIIPEPSAALFGGLGLLALLRRRRVA
jgi:autotransporter-associated beta strand protein